jgi:hypothetical protein
MSFNFGHFIDLIIYFLIPILLILINANNTHFILFESLFFKNKKTLKFEFIIL